VEEQGMKPSCPMAMQEALDQGHCHGGAAGGKDGLEKEREEEHLSLQIDR
jgi:hypothetical protein